MRFALIVVGTALVVWASLSVVAGRGRERASVSERRPRAGASADVAGGSTRARRIGPHARPRPPEPPRDTGWPALLEDLKARDPWTASNLQRGLDQGLATLVRGAWERNGERDPSCGHDDVVALVARVRSSPEELVVSFDAADRAPPDVRECLRAYFAGDVAIHDHDIGGPFPTATFTLAYPLPRRLSERLRRPPG